jgi:hypothetical protein
VSEYKSSPNVVIYDGTAYGDLERLRPRRRVMCLLCGMVLPSISLEELAERPTYIGDAIIGHFQQRHPGTPIDSVGAGMDVGTGARVWGRQEPDQADTDEEPPCEGSVSAVALAKEALSIIQRLSTALRTPEALWDHNLETYRSLISDVTFTETSLMDALSTMRMNPSAWPE